jgi:hypothetical protein
MKLAKQPKDRFSNPVPGGYRDMLLNVTMSNGHVCELQVNVKAMLAAKEVGHNFYEEERSIAGRISAQKRAPNEAESLLLKQLREKQEGVYAKAWEQINGPVKTASLSPGTAILFM